MVIVMKPGVSQEAIHSLVAQLERDHGVTVGITNGVGCSILGLVGDTAHIDMDKLTMSDDVERVMRVQEPYKKANRKFHPEDTVVDVSGVPIGGGDRFTVIAGPCSVESEEQVVAIAKAVKASGATMLRGGAFKPRTSPYAFQGLGATGLEYLKTARQETGLPIVTELMDVTQLPLFKDVDVIQIGARNMQNFDLLKEVGKLSKPVLLKRGLSNSYEEWIMSAEYIMAAGNENVILCERGVRTFETFTRNTLDLSAIPAIRRMSHLPIVVDPSHAAGMYWMVEPLALAAVAAGADGLLIEVHNDPPHAKCDGQQSLKPDEFQHLMGELGKVAAAVESDSADVGMGILSAARAMNLDFIEVGPEEYDFAVPVKFLELPVVQAFIEILKSEEFHEKLEELGGYGYKRCGEVIII